MTDSEIRFYVDDQEYYTAANNDGRWFNKDFFLILNVVRRGTFRGNIEAGFTESVMEVDYIRVYQ